MPEPRRVQPLTVSLVALSVLVLVGCGSIGQPPPDPDGEPTTAVSLTVGSARGGTLDCSGEPGPDCADWFRFQPRRPGQLRVTARSVVPAGKDGEPSTEPGPPLRVQLTDGEGNVLGEAEGPEATVLFRVTDPGSFLALVAADPGTGPLDYELTTKVEKPRPATRALRRPVLEVELGHDGQASHVLIDGGRDQSLRVGLRGRLVQGGKSIGRIRIVEVFQQGSRATVEGALSSPVTPETVAEIALPTH